MGSGNIALFGDIWNAEDARVGESRGVRGRT